MNRNRWIFFAALCGTLTVLLAAYLGRPRVVELTLPAVGKGAAALDLDMRRIRADVEALSATASRVTGYPGAEAAHTHILRALKSMGAAPITTQDFSVAVPIQREGHLEARDAQGNTAAVPIHAVWPNLALTCRTPPEGLSGPLIDVGNGSEDEQEGKRIAGAIVVMNWDTDVEWLSVPEFGGKAVVFRGARAASGALARRKFLSVPADVPRYYVAGQDVPALDALLRAGATVTLHCDSEWREVPSQNILAQVCGGDPAARPGDPDQQPVVFHVYYDSISVVPDLSPGAEQAVGAAVLLELGRYFRAAPAPRPVYLLFTGGHGQSLAGMTHFVRTIHEEKNFAPALMVGLDLSSHSESFGIFAQGYFRHQYEYLIRHKFSTLGSQLAGVAALSGAAPEADATALPSFVDGVNLSSGRGWWTFFPYRVPFESEIPTLAGIPGITLATVNDEHRFVDTPDDKMEFQDFDLLARQLTARAGESAGLARIAVALSRWKGPFLNSPLEDRSASVRGRVLWLDQKKDYTPNEPLAGATVFLKAGRGDRDLMGTRGIPVSMTDAEGRYTFDGMIRTTDSDEFNTCTLEAYATATRRFMEANPAAIDQFRAVVRHGSGAEGEVFADGSMIYGVDMARAGDYPFTVALEQREQHANLVCFPCRSLSLLGLTDPRGYIPLTDVQLLQASTKSSPFQFGQSLPDQRGTNATENLATVWADPTLRVLVNLGLGFQGKRLVLINSTPQAPEGSGFVLQDLKTLPSMVLQGASDMWALDEVRIRKLERNGVSNPRIRRLHDESATLLKEAGAALARCDYRAYRTASERGWALEGRAYSETLGMINNMIRGVLFYLALLLPLSYCLERLLVASETIKKRITGIALIFAASFLLLALAHPAFRFTMTPMLVLLAFIILAMVATVSVLIVAKMDAVLQARKEAAVGRHEDQYRRGGVAVRALDLGMSNIRRRPQRGFLTGLSVVMVTFILLSFTSLVPVVTISRLTHPRGTPTYKGLLARDRAWNPLPDPMCDSLRRSYREKPGSAASGALVAARGWFYSDKTGDLSLIDLSARDSEGKSRCATAAALLCVEPAEAGVTGVNRALLAGRWFGPGDETGIILTERMAARLGYGRGDIGRNVRLFGREVPLVGIVDAAKFDGLTDLDGEPLTPVNMVMQRAKTAEVAKSTGGRQQAADTLEEFVHYPADQVALVTLGYGRQLGATVRSVAIRTGAETDVAAEAGGFAQRSNLTILGSDGGAVTLYTALNTSQVSAAWQILIPMFLGFVMILGTMLGSVYERKNEIFVYNSVGLSPTHVFSLFMAEAAVYAIIGAGSGYLLGQCVSKLLQATGMLAGLTLNYTAGSTILVTLLTMSIVLISAIYPARQAFRAAIPDVDREGVAAAEGSGDAGDALDMYLPFVATEGHVLAMQAYLAEYLESIQGVTVGQLAVDNLRADVEVVEGHRVPVLEFRAWMAPFDLGVSHDVRLRLVFRPDRKMHQYHLSAQLFSGDRQNWRRLTPRFIQNIRKQLLMWRILSAEEHRKYQEAGSRLFGEGRGYVP